MTTASTTSTTPRTLHAEVLRHYPYEDGLTRQRACIDELRNDPQAPERILLVEHTPVVTVGRNGKDGRHLLVDRARLAAEGHDLYDAARGGDVTWHGPGQWTVYPILRLDPVCKDLHRYMRMLEDVILHHLAGHGITGGRIEGKTGVWVGQKKIAAIGVAVTRWISWHGFAYNIQPDLRAFREFMVPCGISPEEGGVTCLRDCTGHTHDMHTEAERLLDSFCAIFPYRRSALTGVDHA